MKIIHCADIHLDSAMRTNLTKDLAACRRAELLDTFERMVRYAADKDITAILIAGDLFDTTRISATAKNVVKDAIQNHPEIDFYYLQGNHDGGSFAASYAALPENLHLFEEEWKSYRLSENVVLTGVELTDHNAGKIYNELDLDRGKINLVTLHGQQGEYIAGEKSESIYLAGLRNKGIDYLALGHVHKYVSEKLDARGSYCYPGCLEGRGFDECGEHGFVVLDIDEEEKQVCAEFVPFAYRKLYTVSVDVSECMTTSEIVMAAKKALEEAGCSKESLIKLELVGKPDADSEKNIEYLENHFRGEFFFLKIKDSTTYRVDYARFENDVSLKGEFIRTVMQEELSEEEKAAIIHYGLQALAGEEILEA